MRPVALLFVLLLALGGSSAQGQSHFRGSSELVVLPVTVTDDDGRLVPDLPGDRFAVYDNGRQQPIALFTNADTPVSVALVIDDSGSMRTKLGEVIAAATTFLRLSNPDDEIFALEFNDSVRDALGGRRLTAADTPELQSALEGLVPQGRTALYDALLDGLTHLEQSAFARKVLILMSDGGDNASEATLDDVLTRAMRSTVTIHAIGLFDPGDRESNGGVLKRLATATGGERFLPRSAGLLVQACQRIAREIRSGYTIGFEPLQRDGKYHRVQVRVQGADNRRDRLVARTRPGYFAASGDRP
jgi:VWFA-related protein